MSQPSQLLHRCLYFTANTLARTVSRMADEAFGRLGLSPSQAFLLMLTIETPGISQKELSGLLHLAPSTISRFTDALLARGLATKQAHGKTARVFPTPEGNKLLTPIHDAWKALYTQYSTLLGVEEGERLTRTIDVANALLENAEAPAFLAAQHPAPASESKGVSARVQGHAPESSTPAPRQTPASSACLPSCGAKTDKP
ncbi:MAG: MarR family winged helix-turn-helix transcriptional regulator [Desulfovibrionaceae bacterium]